MKRLKIFELDSWLLPYKEEVENRLNRLEKTEAMLKEGRHMPSDFSYAHKYFGFHKAGDEIIYREWAPFADELYLIGEFNNWNRKTHKMKKLDKGVFEIKLKDVLKHKMRVKVHVKSKTGEKDRIPLFIKRTVQNKKDNSFDGQIWMPDNEYIWEHDFKRNEKEPLLIYEAHIGMSSEEEKISTYIEFADDILPRIKELGYNTIQLMAIMEHPYYASFGYQVTNFFAVSSWFGTPDDLKYLIDKAHGMGIAVLLDIVHSHTSNNHEEGIADFDGSEEQFFEKGDRSHHPAWGSRLFDYSKPGVLSFLLSNIRFWLEEYRFDGFRFDGITSMLYHDHGLGVSFGWYDNYYGLNVNTDAVTYLQLACNLAKKINKNCILIAEDMSGMPGMCLKVKDGGIGFDYRLAMGIPDFWESTMPKPDDEWNMSQMLRSVSQGRIGEKQVAYAESHDQALVGSKTLIFHMADKDMYWDMDKASQNLTIERAINLHKMIRLITATAGAEAYLNFMGNEFGHPEWIDFPRKGNNWSFKHCKRQWSLGDNGYLRYNDLKNFDIGMMEFLKMPNVMTGEIKPIIIDERKKVISFIKNDYIFIFNFNKEISFEDLEILPYKTGEYRVLLDTDKKEFGGKGRISHEYVYNANPEFKIYSPSRTAMVLHKI